MAAEWPPSLVRPHCSTAFENASNYNGSSGTKSANSKHGTTNHDTFLRSLGSSSSQCLAEEEATTAKWKSHHHNSKVVRKRFSIFPHALGSSRWHFPPLYFALPSRPSHHCSELFSLDDDFLHMTTSSTKATCMEMWDSRLSALERQLCAALLQPWLTESLVQRRGKAR